LSAGLVSAVLWRFEQKRQIREWKNCAIDSLSCCLELLQSFSAGRNRSTIYVFVLLLRFVFTIAEVLLVGRLAIAAQCSCWLIAYQLVIARDSGYRRNCVIEEYERHGVLGIWRWPPSLMQRRRLVLVDDSAHVDFEWGKTFIRCTPDTVNNLSRQAVTFTGIFALAFPDMWLEHRNNHSWSVV
jgi:hypothetical protein